MNPAQMSALRAAVPASLANAAPVSFWEWFGTVYNPMKFIYNLQTYLVTIKPAASTARTTGNLSIQVPIFAFHFRGRCWRQYDGQPPQFPIRAGIAMLSGNDWTFGNWDFATVTGTGLAGVDYTFEWPREVPASTQLTITLDNTLNAAALEGDWGIVGLEPRRRDQPLTSSMINEGR